MTDPVPAAASGLPIASTTFDRRNFLATLAAAGVMTAGTAVPALAADHPDTALLERVAALHAAQAQWDVIDADADAVFDRYEAMAPAVPPALLFQEGRDTFEICYDPKKLHAIEIGGEERSFYGAANHVKGLRWKIEKWRQYGTGKNVLKRAEEIVAAIDPYLSEVQRAEDESGVTAFHARSLRNQDVIDRLQREIASLPASTAEGVAAKARAASTGWSKNVDWLEADLLPRMLAGERHIYADRIEIVLAVSLIVDAMKLGTAPASAPSSERSAA